MLKVQIGVRINTILPGYLNIDLAARPEEQDRVMADPSKLDVLVDANECSEILVNDTLDYLPPQARQQILDHWLTRLAHGGSIVITGLDPHEVSRLLYKGQIDFMKANEIIYGIGKKSFCVPEMNIQIALRGNQMSLDYLKSDEFNYIIRLVRK